MSGLAGPSSHAYPSFSVRPQQPPAISTKLRRVADVDSAPPSAVTPATPAPTAPPTPVARAQSIAETEARQNAWVSAAVLKLQPWDGPFATPLSFSGAFSLAGAALPSSHGHPRD